MTDLSTLYDEDFVAWSKHQADALRSAARTGSNHLLDWENLAEEIESLGISQKTALRSQVRRIIRHLVKLENSPTVDPYRGWRESVRDARAEIEDLLQTSPSLRTVLQAIIVEETGRGARLAIADLDDHGDLSGSRKKRLKSKIDLDLLTYTEDQILGDWFPEAPKV
jgi:hypothetical protein